MAELPNPNPLELRPQPQERSNRPKTKTKKYRLKEGIHYLPNPDFREGTDSPSMSHVTAKAGDVIELTDEQYEAFKYKFVPTDSGKEELKSSQTSEAAKQ